MNSLRFSGSAWPETCSAETVVPRITNMSHAGVDDGLRELLGALRGQRAGDGDARVAHLLEPGGDQLGLDRLGVDLLQPRAAARGPSSPATSASRSRRVVVPGPEALEVEHAETAVLAERDRGLRRHHRVHRRRHDRQLEAVGVDLPGDRDLLGVARAARRARSRGRRTSTRGVRAWRDRSRFRSREDSIFRPQGGRPGAPPPTPHGTA